MGEDYTLEETKNHIRNGTPFPGKNRPSYTQNLFLEGNCSILC